jgi:hypothetical protein
MRVDGGTIEVGRAAWGRIRDHGRRCFDDWIVVARALAIGRTAALKAAGTNQATGTTYNRCIAAWLGDNGLAGINSQERYGGC